VCTSYIKETVAYWVTSQMNDNIPSFYTVQLGEYKFVLELDLQ